MGNKRIKTIWLGWLSRGLGAFVLGPRFNITEPNKEGMTMITIIRKRLLNILRARTSRARPSREAPMRNGPPRLVLIGGMCLLLLLYTLHFTLYTSYAQDYGAEFRAKDDLTVQGTEGTKNDADLEVKGVSAFSKDVFIEAGILAGPYGGLGRYENLLLQSEDFSTTWTATNATLAANAISPDTATNGATTLTVATASPGYVYQTVTTTVTLSYTLSVWAKAGTGTNLTLELTTNGTDATTDSGSFTLTSDWQRYSLTKSTGDGTDPTTVTATIKTTASVGETILIWGAQLEQSSTPGVYVQTQAAAVTASRGVVSGGDILMSSLKLSGGTITDTTGAVTVGSIISAPATSA